MSRAEPVKKAKTDQDSLEMKEVIEDDIVISAEAMQATMYVCNLRGYVALDFNTVKVPKKVVTALETLKKLELLDLPIPVEQALLRLVYNHRNGMAVHYPQLIWHLAFDRDRLLPPPDHLKLELVEEVS